VRVDLETTKIDFTLANKSNELNYSSKVESTKITSPYKASSKPQSAVKSTPKFEAGKSDTAFGKKPASRSVSRGTGGAGSAKSKPDNKISKSKKVVKKTTKRKVKK
jgi:ribonuclease R